MSVRSVGQANTHHPTTPLSGLSIACKTANLANVRFAISRGEQPDAKTLDYAIETGDENIVQAVISTGALPTPDSLTLACKCGSLAIVHKIAMAGARPGKRTLSQALQNRDPKVGEFIKSIGAKPDGDSLGLELLSVLQNDQFCMDRQRLEDLVQQGAKLPLSDLQLITEAFNKGGEGGMGLQYVQLIIKAGAKASQSDINHILHYFTKHRTCDSIQLLQILPMVIAAGGRPTAEDRSDAKLWYKRDKFLPQLLKILGSA